MKNQLTKLVTVFKKNYCNIQGNLSQKFYQIDKKSLRYNTILKSLNSIAKSKPLIFQQLKKITKDLENSLTI